MDRRCAACTGANAEPWFRGLVRCRDCGLIYFQPRISHEQTAQLYDEHYFNGSEYYRYLDDAGIHNANFRSRARDLTRWLPPKKRLFEVGCAYGLFLNESRRIWSVAGCDISPGPCRHARDILRLDVQCSD